MCVQFRIGRPPKRKADVAVHVAAGAAPVAAAVGAPAGPCAGPRAGSADAGSADAVCAAPLTQQQQTPDEKASRHDLKVLNHRAACKSYKIKRRVALREGDYKRARVYRKLAREQWGYVREHIRVKKEQTNARREKRQEHMQHALLTKEPGLFMCAICDKHVSNKSFKRHYDNTHRGNEQRRGGVKGEIHIGC